jgi:RNA polymerase sigma-70 factor (ECF subfamily)
MLAAAGDAHAFARLYRQHAGRIHTLARRMTSDDDADELTQDVFVRAWEKLRTFRGESAFGTWLHRLAVNLILAKRARRGQAPQPRRGGDEALETAPGRTPELAMDFERAIGRLPRRRTADLRAVRRGGVPPRGDRRMLGLSVGTSARASCTAHA